MEGIQNYMNNLLEGTHNGKGPISNIWDCVAISAADVEQKEGFEHQIHLNLESGAIPKSITYVVISDPSGPPVGSGGATFHMLEHLYNLYGDSLYLKKILIVHAGGSSKRLPNFTCTGKLFCSLPMESNGKTCNILNLKLIITSPFIQLMKNGGILIAGSDDIETYSLEGIENLTCSLDGDGVVALAHPSNIAIGSTHGVYVLPSQPSTKENCWLSNCLEVLQKPSHSTMKNKGALLNTNEEEKVYTDSMFWCGPALVKQMIAFAKSCQGLYEAETCIYGDFLACMGTRPAQEKLYWQEISVASQLKRNIASHFQATHLEILVLEQSCFYHLGTMSEYVENLQPSASLFKTLGMKSFVGCQGLQYLTSLNGIAINSIVKAQVELKDESIMDHCIIDVPLKCERRTILSQCHIDDPEIVIIPTGWLFHTATLMEDEELLYVTIAFLLDDNLKGSVGHSQSWKNTPSAESCSLWAAKLFEAKDTMAKSFTATWKSVMTGCSVSNNLSSIRRYSMEDVIKLKHLPTMLDYIKSLTKPSDYV